MAEAGHAAADHDQAGVEEADEPGDDLPDAAAALADQVAARPGRRPRAAAATSLGGQRARALQPGGEFGGPPARAAASASRARAAPPK